MNDQAERAPAVVPARLSHTGGDDQCGPQADAARTQWLEPTEQYEFAVNDVHVWRSVVPRDAAWIPAFSRVLSADEREKAARFHFEADRSRFVLGRGMMRHVLARRLHRSPDELRFEYGPFGKPALAPGGSKGRLQFNLSHSGDLILLAVAIDRAIGIDVERMRTDISHTGIAERFFSAAERSSLAGLPPSARAAAFCACWTRKEAFIKATGVGLSLPLDQFDVSLAPGEAARLMATRPDPAEAQRWTLLELPAGPDYKAAAAVEGAGFRLSTWDWGAGAFA
jgi:4'-phosphopantetheinyl transferase